MKIDLGQEVVFEVHLANEVYNLKEPSVKYMSRFQKSLDKSEDDGLTEFVNLMTDMGMPGDVAESLGILSMKKLIDGVMGGISEKK